MKWPQTMSMEILDEFGITPRKVMSRIGEWTDSEFVNFFAAYRKSRLEEPMVTASEAGSTDIFPDSVSGNIPIRLIKKLGLYANRIHIHDPIIELDLEFQLKDTHFENLIRHASADDRLQEFRAQFADRVERFLWLRPLIDSAIVIVVPSQLMLPSREAGEIYQNDFYGPKGQLDNGEIKKPSLELPEGLAKFVNDNLKITNASIGKNGTQYFDGELRPSRTIAIRFADNAEPMVFCLGDTSVNSGDTESRSISMFFPLDSKDAPVDVPTFENWVLGESQRYIRDRLDRLSRDIYLASQSNAAFLTTTPSSRDLATVSFESETAPDSEQIKTLIELDLPYFAGMKIIDIAKARQEEAAFHNFRVAFDDVVRTLKATPADERNQRVQEITRDLIVNPMAQIDKRMKSLHRDVFIDSSLLIGALVSTIFTAGSNLLVLASAGAITATGIKAGDSYKKSKSKEDDIKSEQSFFYWKAAKNARKK